jgi:hypothetical protein
MAICPNTIYSFPASVLFQEDKTQGRGSGLEPKESLHTRTPAACTQHQSNISKQAKQWFVGRESLNVTKSNGIYIQFEMSVLSKIVYTYQCVTRIDVA